MKDFSEQQREAVFAAEHPVLLLAVPGGGKTTVLVTRLGYLIRCLGIAPEQILTLTYTVAATRDMAERYRSIFGESDGPGGQVSEGIPSRGGQTSEEVFECRGQTSEEVFSRGRQTPEDMSGRGRQDRAAAPEFRTINGICAKIIQFYGRQIGKEPFALFSNEGEILRLIAEIYRAVQDDFATPGELRMIRTEIAYIKNSMLTEDEVREMDGSRHYALSEIYFRYHAHLRGAGLMDYDDQIVYAKTMLERSPAVLEHFRKMYPYICVDEAQDTSKIQHAVIRLLAGDGAGLFMVGDEDQSIYGFRAAYPEALLHFERDYAGARVLLMENNYRSNARIVEAADRFIQKNAHRHEKHMKPARPAESEIRIVDLKGRGAQYTYLAKAAESCRDAEAGASGRELPGQSLPVTAVLYRDNESAIPLVDLLDRKGLPYRIRNAEPGFFTGRIVTDIRNILLFAEHPGDPELFMKIYYKMSTYLTREAAEALCRSAARRAGGRTFADGGIFAGVEPDAAGRPAEGLFSSAAGGPVGDPFSSAAGGPAGDLLSAAVRSPGLSVGTLRAVREIRKNLAALHTDSAAEAVSRIVGKMGYGSYLERTGIPDRSVGTLKALARREETPGGLLRRLDELAEIFEGGVPDPGCRFVLSTIHSSKGLEYDTVYLMDVEDGTFPEHVPERENGAGARRTGAASWESGVGARRAGAVPWESGAGARRTGAVPWESGVGARRAGAVPWESGAGARRTGAVPWESGAGARRADEEARRERAAYEEERRLFYVGVTRAKHTLCLFRLPGGSSFIRELTKPQRERQRETLRAGAGAHRFWPGEEGAPEPPKEEYGAFADRLKKGAVIRHRAFGRGEILEFDGRFVTVRFRDVVRNLSAEVLYRKELIKVVDPAEGSIK